MELDQKIYIWKFEVISVHDVTYACETSFLIFLIWTYYIFIISSKTLCQIIKNLRRFSFLLSAEVFALTINISHDYFTLSTIPTHTTSHISKGSPILIYLCNNAISPRYPNHICSLNDNISFWGHAFRSIVKKKTWKWQVASRGITRE